jgi:hypothetical protein
MRSAAAWRFCSGAFPSPPRPDELCRALASTRHRRRRRLLVSERLTRPHVGELGIVEVGRQRLSLFGEIVSLIGGQIDRLTNIRMLLMERVGATVLQGTACLEPFLPVHS